MTTVPYLTHPLPLTSPPPYSRAATADCLNGIAYNSSDGTYLLTGKLWPKYYRVRFGSSSRGDGASADSNGGNGGSADAGQKNDTIAGSEQKNDSDSGSRRKGRGSSGGGRMFRHRKI